MKITLDSSAIIIGSLVGLGVILVVGSLFLSDFLNNRVVSGNTDLKFKDGNGKIRNLKISLDDNNPEVPSGRVPENGPYGVRRASLPYWRA